jgi:predicted SnoaL-like aldol condensation-catalyzing enzyme
VDLAEGGQSLAGRIENGKIAEHWDGAVKPQNP